MARFVLGEWSWPAVTRVDPIELAHAVAQLLDRLDTARERQECVVKHEYFYETDLGDGVSLYEVLYEVGCQVQLDRDLSERLRLALDRTRDFDDSNLCGYDADFGGHERTAPGVAWAHACCSERHHVAVLPLPVGEAVSGWVNVAVEGITRCIFFATDEGEHVYFFRSLIDLENADETMFERLAPSAFPTLEWSDNVWSGLRDFSRPFVNVRKELVRYLGGLNDGGAQCFFEHRIRNPQQLSTLLSIEVGAETSDENGQAKKDTRSRKERTRLYRGVERVFWWHVKMRRHIDRIHFTYLPPSKDCQLPTCGQIVVGLFKDHCYLPR